MPQNDPYGALLGETQKPAADPYGALVDGPGQIRAALTANEGQDQQGLARARQIARDLNVPVEAVKAMPDEMAREARVNHIDNTTLAAPTLRQHFRDADFATLAEPEAPLLAKIEGGIKGTVRYVMGAEEGGGLPTFAGNTAKKAGYASMYGASGVSRAVTDLLDGFLPNFDPSGPNFLRDLSENSGRVSRYYEAKMKGVTFQGNVAGEGVQSGVSSAISQAKYLPLLAFGAPGAAFALGGMIAETFGQTYNEQRDAGNAPVASAVQAIPDAVVEGATEMAPMFNLAGDLAKGTPFLESLLKQVVPELKGEQIATFFKDFNAWARDPNPNKNFADFLSDRPRAAVVTAIATVFGTGGNIAISKGLDTIMDGQMQRELDATLKQHEALTELIQNAAGSKVRELDPDTFRKYVQAAADNVEGAPKSVFVDGGVLLQTLQSAGITDEQLAQLLPGVPAQLADASAMNSPVEIPIGDLATALPGTPLEQALLPNLRMDGPDALSQVEAEQARDNAQELLQQKTLDVIQQAQDSERITQGAKVVYDSMKTQMMATGRMSEDVAAKGAALVREYYTVMSSYMGTTPDALFAANQYKVAAQGQNTGVLNDTGRPGALNLEGYHYSTQARPVISGHAFGSGLKGSGQEMYASAADKRLRNRSYFYVDTGNGITPEAGVGGIGHKVNLSNIYDANSDPLRLRKGGQLAFESAVLDRGFDGYLDRLSGTQPGQVVVLGDKQINAEVLGPLGKTNGKVAPPTVERESRGRDQVVDRINANKTLPAGSPTLARWAEILQAQMPAEYEAMRDAGVFSGDGSEALYKSELVSRFENLTPGEDYSQAGVRDVRREEKKIAGLARIEKNLTPAERDKLNKGTAKRLVDQFKGLPPTDQFVAAAWAGRAKRGWYKESANAIAQVFGPDAPRFAGLLAAMSPQNSVETNLHNALNTWKNWNAAGRPTSREDIVQVMGRSVEGSGGVSSVLDAWINNSVRALTTENPGRDALSGPKVDSFMRNLLHDVEQVTNDAWMANFAFVDQKMFKGSLNATDAGKGPGYLAMSAKVREAARVLTEKTGETWTPAEVQETIWSWAKTLYEAQDANTTASDILFNEQLTHDMIRATPDFKGLFHDAKYEKILRDAGYGAQLDALDTGAAGSEVSDTSGEAGPFDSAAQYRHELASAKRLEDLRRLGKPGGGDTGVYEQSGVGWDSPGGFAPLPGAPKIEGASGPDPRLVAVAEQYAASLGIPLKRQSDYVKVDPVRAAALAAEYDAMEHAPQDPAVKEAYANLIQQTLAQYRALEAAGYKFYFFDETNDPYQGNPWNAMRDLRANQRMGVFATESGFGSGATELNVDDNPLLADTGVQWPYGSERGTTMKRVLANDLFRAVHDAFGHGLEGAGFRAEGEENAWQAHVRLFTGSAVAAITSETRGQNSWLNYGPFGEANRNAKVEDTVFADQKTGLMPAWTWDEGRAGDAMDSDGKVIGKLESNIYAQGARATLDDFSPENIGGILGKDSWAILTAENPMGEQASAEDNAADMAELKADLDALGARYTEAVGKYGQVENSLVVTGISEADAVALGAKYAQDAVLTHRGLVYPRDGSVTPVTGKVDVFSDAPEDFYTTIPATGAKFAIELDWREGATDYSVKQTDKGFEALDSDGKVIGKLESNITPEQSKQINEPASVDIVKVNDDRKGQGVGRALYAAWNDAHEGRITPSGKTSPDAWKLWKRNYPEKVAEFVQQEALRIAQGSPESQVLGNITDPEIKQAVVDAVPNKYQAKYAAKNDLLNQDVKAQYDALADKPLAPNGKPSNLTKTQHRIVRTPEFKAWFGDWEKFANVQGGVWSDDKGEVSKAVDENGEPLVVYHGTNLGGFNTFRETGGERRGDLGIFLTPNKEMARSYVRRGKAQVLSREQIDGDVGKPGIYALFANIREPHEENFNGANWSGERIGQFEAYDANGDVLYNEDGDDAMTLEEARKLAEDNDGSFEEASPLPYTTDSVTREARKYKNDGAIVRDVQDDGGGVSGYAGEPSDLYVAFDPAQVKSVENFGAFDPGNPNILAQPTIGGARGTFNPATLTTVLNENADLSTFLHETGHFFLEMTMQLASTEGAPAEVTGMAEQLLKSFGVKDMATWNGMTLDQKRKHHERFAETFEMYLLEGKAPSTELQSLFRVFRAWLTRVYKSLQQFAGDKGITLDKDLTDVMDRMLATEAQIAEAEKVAGLIPELDATGEAIEQLNARSMRDLKWAVNARNKFIAAAQREARETRKAVQAEVTVEVDGSPEMRAKKALDALRVDPDYTVALKTWNEERAEQLKQAKEALESELRAANPEVKGLQLGQLMAKNKRQIANQAEARTLEWEKQNPKPKRPVNMTDADVATVADSFGYESPEQMVAAIDAFGPRDVAIEGMTDQRMLERHGDLTDQAAIEQAATEAVHNKARAKSLATELSAQQDMVNARGDTGKTDAAGRKVTVNVLMEAAKQFAANVIGKRNIGDLKKAAWAHTQAERRAGVAWQAATKKGDTQAAVKAKQDQVLNNAAVRAAQEAITDVQKTIAFFNKVTRGNSETVVEKGRDPDIVNAARAILAVYGVAPFAGKNAFEYMDLLKANDPGLYAVLENSVRGAMANAKPLDKLTVSELGALRDEIASMWHLAKSSRQYEVAGNKMDIAEAGERLVDRLVDKGIPDRVPGEGHAVTEREKFGRSLQFAGALLRRVESWAESVDGKFGGPFLRLVYQPVKEAADRYRSDRIKYRKAFTALVENVAPELRPGVIDAPELGYTFGKGKSGSGQMELTHALLHLGNESNKRKLLLGRGWATETEGVLDTSKWDAFMKRMHETGTVNKAHYDFAQGVWDLLDSMKPLAQKTHRDVFGRYFAEVTANPFEVEGIGYYRGGYVPAQVDPEVVKDNEIRKLAELENENMAYAFPTTNKGFTKSRTEYNRPLLLDLHSLPQHIDKVLLFSHMEPVVRGVSKVLQEKGVAYNLNRVDPSAISGMLSPWLTRSARQIVETPVVGDGRVSRVLSVVRQRAGMSVMFGNLSNTLQQITGASIAAVKVKPKHLMQAMAQYTSSPKKTTEAVAKASEFMAHRMENEVAALNSTMDEILLNPSVYKRAENWTTKHTYFLQSAFDNVISPVVWTGAYNQALEEGMTEPDAVRFADGTIRQTQGSTLPEDVSRIETGPAYARVFTQFIGYFNMVANTNVTALRNIANDMGMRKGAGKALPIVFFGLLAPAWIAEAIAQAFRGGPGDDDGDGSFLDDWLASVFGMGTLKTVLAGIPFVGQFALAGINSFNSKPYDDKTNLSPAVSMLEGAVGAPHSVYKALAEDGSKQKAVRDLATAVSLATGLPAGFAARPLGYLAGVAAGEVDPTSAVDAVRGVATGSPSPESKR